MAQANRFWHPFADMTVVAGHEIVVERGEGVWLWDTAGRRYLDANAGLWYCAVGHGRAELAEAAADQMGRLAAYSTFGPFASPPVLALAERLAGLAPLPGAVAFLTSGGSEAVDTAAKLARRYWNVMGEPDRQAIITREFSYHGMAAFGTSIAGIGPNAAGYGDLVPHTIRVPYDDPGAIRRAIEERHGRVAAVFGEPVIGAGGIYPPPEGYWEEVAAICKETGVLFVADEVVTGFGRIGHWFGSSRYKVEPDIAIFAKGVTSGYFPLGGILVGPRVSEPFWQGQAGMFRHGFTYSGHTAGAAVALANLDIIEREGLVVRAATMEAVLERVMRPLEDNPRVAEVRTVGMLAAIELGGDAIAADPQLGDRVVARLREHGVLLRVLMGKSLQVSPPLVIEEADLKYLAAAIEAAIAEA